MNPLKCVRVQVFLNDDDDDDDDDDDNDSCHQDGRKNTYNSRSTCYRLVQKLLSPASDLETLKLYIILKLIFYMGVEWGKKRRLRAV
jgi:hypothetical protein